MLCSKVEFYTALDGARNQFTREVMAALTWSDWSLTDDLVQKLLSDAFSVPCTTKPYAEDVFRDMRRAFLNVPVSKVSPWSRQTAALKSLMNRSDKKILKVMSPKKESLTAFRRLRHKRLLTAAIFSPMSNKAKSKKSTLGTMLRLVMFEVMTWLTGVFSKCVFHHIYDFIYDE